MVSVNAGTSSHGLSIIIDLQSNGKRIYFILPRAWSTGRELVRDITLDIGNARHRI